MMTYPLVNRLFTLLCFAFPPVVGSVVSFLWNGGALWSMGEVLSRRRPLNLDPAARRLTLFLCIYVLASVTATLVNGFDVFDYGDVLPLGTFLLFPFSYSVWSIADKRELARAAVIGSMLGCYGAVVWAAFQFHMLDIRAEAGSGNALVFATAVLLAGSVSLAGVFFMERALALPLIGAFLAATLALIYSGARLMWVTECLVFVMVLYVYRAAFIARLTLPVGIFLSVLAAAVIVIGFDIVTARIDLLFDDWNRLAWNDDYSSSMGLRVALWQVGLALFADNPLLGYGMHATGDLVRQGLDAEYHLSNTFSHFHNGLLTIAIESGVVGLLAVLAVFFVAARTAVATLSTSADPVARFGAVILAILVTVYLVGGMTNLIVGHDILDALLMVFLIVGTFLASGVSLAPPPAELT
ncbi:O-antigen ligase family protein [Aquibium sp. A9E412]|uniref:O-antigen ligase family protein n=1 Tax=Aquibium sp. A9E412 TaxID=2976767 RepID=UPI0025AFEC4D|nr:O-antigen ligase family protein [Aquibium sp. A9E412]MDN2566845.1 O-antigen ligase family protein [Aquibium sp. A9E412]